MKTTHHRITLPPLFPMTQQQQNQNPAETQNSPNYDRHMIDGETAARMEREGANFKQKPESTEGEPNNTSGYTMDREGRLNNFAIEPEMYVNEPGDRHEALAEEAEVEAAKRAEVNHPGGRGPGMI